MTNYRIVQSELKQKLAAGAITNADLSLAAEMTRKLGSRMEDRILFANIKRQAEQNVQKESQFQHLAEQVVGNVEGKKADADDAKTVAEMRTLLKQIEKSTAGRDDAQSRQLLEYTQKRYAITRILNDLPADEQEGEFNETAE